MRHGDLGAALCFFFSLDASLDSLVSKRACKGRMHIPKWVIELGQCGIFAFEINLNADSRKLDLCL